MATEKNDSSNSFAARLAELMAARGQTQASLGEAVGVSQATVFKWLKGTLPRSGELYRVAKYFGQTMEALLEGIEQKSADPADSDTKRPVDLQADRLRDFLEAFNWTLADFERVLDAMRGIGSTTELFQFDRQSGVDKLRQTVNKNAVTFKQLLGRVLNVTAARGKKASLAAYLEVPPSRLSEWLSGTHEPGAEVTLQMLEWVTAEEAKTKSPDTVRAASEPKTRTKDKQDESPKSRPRKRSHRGR